MCHRAVATATDDAVLQTLDAVVERTTAALARSDLRAAIESNALAFHTVLSGRPGRQPGHHRGHGAGGRTLDQAGR